jgi:putative membrane protein
MSTQLPYCGVAPSPGELAARFNLDPLLLVALAGLLVLHWAAAKSTTARRFAVCGWLVTALALTSPLCALSVSLFSARVLQHMLLILIAAPLLALSLPPPRVGPMRSRLWGAALLFFLALWFWHMPVPYDATFFSTPTYWAMHVTLFGSAVLLWRELLQSPREQLVDVLLVGSLSSMQMGLLGSVLAMASRPLYLWHMSTTQVWGLSPLEDQQLGGTFMWVPGIALFLWAAVRALRQLRGVLPSAQSR